MCFLCPSIKANVFLLEVKLQKLFSPSVHLITKECCVMRILAGITRRSAKWVRWWSATPLQICVPCIHGWPHRWVSPRHYGPGLQWILHLARVQRPCVIRWLWAMRFWIAPLFESRSRNRSRASIAMPSGESVLVGTVWFSHFLCVQRHCASFNEEK